MVRVRPLSLLVRAGARVVLLSETRRLGLSAARTTQYPIAFHPCSPPLLPSVLDPSRTFAASAVHARALMGLPLRLCAVARRFAANKHLLLPVGGTHLAACMSRCALERYALLGVDWGRA